MSGAGATAGSCPVLLPLSAWVSLHLPRAITSGSLYGLLTRFRELALPGVRFAPVWPSTGRTARLAEVWWGRGGSCGAVTIVLRGVLLHLACV